MLVCESQKAFSLTTEYSITYDNAMQYIAIQVSFGRGKLCKMLATNSKLHSC